MFKSLFFALFWHLWLCWRASYFISDHLLFKNLLRTLCVNISLNRKMMICSRPMAELLWKSLQKMTWKMRYIIFHEGARNIIFTGYGNFCRHGFKTWKRWPNVLSFDSCPSYPGYKSFFPRVRVDASVSVAGRQLTETGNRAWKVCGTQGMSILTIRSKRRQETVLIPKSSLK